MPERKKRRSKRNDLSGLKEVETQGVDFFALLAGMVTSLAVFFLIWNQLSEPASSKVAPPDTGGVADANALTDLLLELGQQPLGKKPTEQVEHHRRCFEIADRILSIKHTHAQEKIAKKSKLDSLTKIYGLNYVFKLEKLDVLPDVREVAGSYRDDSNASLARSAHLALYKVNVLELARSASNDAAQQVSDEVVKLANQYSQDEFVASTIRLVLDVYVSENPKQGQRSIQILGTRKHEFAETMFCSIFQDYSDLALLQEAQYQSLFDNRWVKGSLGQDELVRTSIDLINQRDFGELLVFKVDEVAHWFEQEDQYEKANQIYESMLTAAETAGLRPDVGRLVKETATNGLQRIRLFQKKIEFTGVAPDGSEIRSEDFRNRVVVVVYWSPTDADSVDELRRFHNQTSGWAGKPISVLAVCDQPNATEALNQIVAELSRFQFVIGDPDKTVERGLSQLCPSRRVPRAMLIARDGVVVDVNVPMGELKTTAEGI